MTLFEGEQNGRYETDHLHMVMNEHIDFTEEGLSDDRKYSIFVHEYVHYYQGITRTGSMIHFNGLKYLSLIYSLLQLSFRI